MQIVQHSVCCDLDQGYAASHGPAAGDQPGYQESGAGTSEAPSHGLDQAACVGIIQDPFPVVFWWLIWRV